MIYTFGDCTLDGRLYELRRDGVMCHVEPQVFNVLLYLLQHRQSVVAKEEMLEEVWGDQFVSEATLNSRIMGARKAIGDDGSAQRFIKTVRGRGFRFVGAVQEREYEEREYEEREHQEREYQECEHETPAENPTALSQAEILLPATDTAGGPVFGREDELQHLRRRWDAALAGRRQTIFVTGEAGLGKTTLVNAFLSENKNPRDLWVLWGQCLDQRGAGEAYMPLLEALGRLCREPQNKAIVDLLRQCAPTWLVQLPWLVRAEEWELLERRVVGTTRERMLREMVETLEALAAQRPLLLVLEDLHWSDYSTLDLLSFLARRQETARLMIIGTYRPADVQASGHPLRARAQELRIRGHCAELALGFLSEAAIAGYLQSRFPGLEQTDKLAAIVQERTGRNPLFMRLMVNGWLDRGWLEQRDGHWMLQVELYSLAAGVPDNLRHLIEQQIEQLTPEDQKILETASVAGIEFSATAVSEENNTEEVESRCAELARQGCFLSSQGATAWPDGTLTERFGFTHHLYQEVLYECIPAGRRSRLHRQIGDRLEAGYGRQTKDIAPELAVHFTRGRDAERAVFYLQQAAEQALSRSACREAIAHLRQALAVVQGQSDSPERAQREIELQSMLAPALIAINGWMMPDAEQAYLRVCALCERLDARAALESAIYGLATIYEVRGEYQKAQAMLEQRLQLLQGAGEVMPQTEKPLLESYELLACSLYHQGQFEQAWRHADNGLKYYQPEWYSETMAALGENGGVACHAWAALSLWFAGYPDRALERMQDALELANLPNHGFSLASVMTQAGVLHQLRGEVEKVGAYAGTTLKLADEGGFPYRIATGSILRGWTLAAQREHEEGIRQLRKGLDMCRSMGAIYDYPYYLALLAETCCWAGRCAEGLEAVAEALATMQKSRRFFCQAELQRLQGELLLQANQRNPEPAESLFQQALATARDVQSKSLELRAATSLGRFWQQQGRRGDAHQLLAPVYHSFTEGFNTPHLQQAGALLEELQQDARGSRSQPQEYHTAKVTRANA